MAGQNNLAIRDNYLTYFSYRVHDNKIGYNDFYRALTKSKEEDIPAIVKAWCDGDILSKKESLFSHLSISKDARSRDVRIKNNYLAMMIAMVPYCDELPIQDVFRRALSGRTEPMIHDKYLGVITKTVSNSDDYMTWNRILARLYSYESYDYNENVTRDKYQSMFTDEEIVGLAELNWNNFVKANGMPKASDFTTYGTIANNFLSEACVESAYNIVDGEGYRSSLIIDKLTKDFSHQYSPDFEDFISPFDLNDDDMRSGFESDICESIRTKIEELFGDINKYKEFIKSTFTASDENKERYFKRVGI